MVQKTSARCLIISSQDSKTSCRDVFKVSKRQLFCQSKQSQGEAIRQLASYDPIFKISKRQLFFKSSQCLSKPLFRQLIHTFKNYPGWDSGYLAIHFCQIRSFQGWFYLVFEFFRVFYSKFCHFSGSKFLLTQKLFASQFSGIW